jgi:geranylgeranyl diphosphate synthase, type I
VLDRSYDPANPPADPAISPPDPAISPADPAIPPVASAILGSSPAIPPSPVLPALRHEVDTALTVALDRLLPRLTAVHPSLAPVAAELRAFTASGKRVRPALLLLGYAAAGGADRRTVHGPALALELLHTCALVHDDVIDRAATRRGRPTVHHGFARHHREQGWAGDAAAYGEAVAILLGDLAFVQADELFLAAEVAPDQLLAGFRRFTALREEVMSGQYLDLQAATSRTTDRELALTVATLKSGRYSVARPLEIGALLAGAGAELVAGLGAFGDPLGRAFQLRDDLLGVFGEEHATGKSASSDLAEGKRTLLVAEAAARLTVQEWAELEAGLGDPTLSDATADRLRALLERCGARTATEATIDAAVAEARSALAALDLPAPAAAALGEVAEELGYRIS